MTNSIQGPTDSQDGQQHFFENYGVWKEAPILTGTTKFEPLPDVKNIMITGGAGFMFVTPLESILKNSPLLTVTALVGL